MSQKEQQSPQFRIGGHGGRGVRQRMSLMAAGKPKDVWATSARIWGYLKRWKASLALVFLSVAVAAMFGLLAPYLTGKAIDTYILGHDLPGLTRIVLLIFAVTGCAAVATWLQDFIMASVAQRTVRDLRNALFSRLQTLPVRFFDQRATGDLMSRFTNDVDFVSSTLSQSVSQLMTSTLRLAGATVMMLALNWRLALVTLATVPWIALLAKWASSRTLRGYREQQEAIGELNGIIEENVAGARIVKAYCREQAAIQEFDGVNERLRIAATKAMTFAMVLPPLMNLANNLSFAIVAGAGGWMAVRGWATIGTIVAFISYSQQFGRPLNQLGNLFNTIQAALAGAERVFEIIDEEPEDVAPPDALPPGRVRGDVVFEGVTFGYNPGAHVLKDVSLRAQPGQTIALVGPTGAGKTTIVNVLSRFYDIEAGTIWIDGRDSRRLPKDDLRRQLGIVLQDSFLFSRTVMENIRYGRLDASDEEVLSAAKLANADAFIRHLPQEYHTPLSERGGNLSQGQRQLLAIARAILADPAILILDEATSSVDTRTEKHIQEAMRRLMSGRTSLVIAHRLSTIRDADMILVINNGQIIERGDHVALMARRGFYHNLYMSQFKGHGVTT